MPAKNTTELLKQLRSLMRNVDVVKEPLEAYIIVSQDAHSVLNLYMLILKYRNCMIVLYV